MSATNKQIVEKGISEYREKIFREVEGRCRALCMNLCDEAISARQSAPGKHNFTGNLLNSIVVCLYKFKSPVYACYAADKVTKAIQVKMTAPRKYRFRSDYDLSESTYSPQVKTNQGWGEEDARQFFQSYSPKGRNVFDIIVAYPTEYAEFVENLRSTTGVLRTYAHAQEVAVNFLKLPRT